MFLKRVLLALLYLLPMSFVSCAAETRLSAAIALGLMGEDGGDKLFYYPTKDQPRTPLELGYAYEDVFFVASDGVRLHGWWMPAKSPKATVVYSHGNAGSVGHHLVFVQWLVDAGYNVLLYDYRGYGRSAGEITKAGVVKDAQAAFAYVSKRKDVDKIISFGHSLGGAKSIAALGQSAPMELKAVIVDSTFASYQDMAERVAGVQARKVVSDAYEPYIYINKLPKIPVMIVHGTADGTIPFAQAQKLFEAANHPKMLMEIEGADHVNCFFIEGNKYRRDLLKWMADVVE